MRTHHIVSLLVNASFPSNFPTTSPRFSRHGSLILNRAIVSSLISLKIAFLIALQRLSPRPVLPLSHRHWFYIQKQKQKTFKQKKSKNKKSHSIMNAHFLLRSKLHKTKIVLQKRKTETKNKFSLNIY